MRDTILEFFGIGRKARLIKLARKVRAQHRRFYAIAAGYFPKEYLSLETCGEGAGKIRYYRISYVGRKKILQSKRTAMHGIRAYRKEYPQVSLAINLFN